MTDRVLALLAEARQHWDDNPPEPPSDEAASLARHLVTVKTMPQRQQAAA